MILMIIELVSSGESHSGGKRDSQAVGAKHLLTTTEVNAGNTDKDHVNSVIADPTKTTTTVTKEVESSEFQGSTESIEINSGTQKETIKIKSWEDFEYKNVWVLEGGQKVLHTYSWYLEQMKNNVTVELIINGTLVKKDPVEEIKKTIKTRKVQKTCIGNHEFSLKFEDDAHTILELSPQFQASLLPQTTFEQAIVGFVESLGLRKMSSGFKAEFQQYGSIDDSLYSAVNRSVRIHREYLWPLMFQSLSDQFEGEIAYAQAEEIVSKIEDSTTTLFFSLTRPNSWRENESRVMNSIDFVVARCNNPEYVEVFLYSANVFADLTQTAPDKATAQPRLSPAALRTVKSYTLSLLYSELTKQFEAEL